MKYSFGQKFVIFLAIVTFIVFFLGSLYFVLQDNTNDASEVLGLNTSKVKATIYKDSNYEDPIFRIFDINSGVDVNHEEASIDINNAYFIIGQAPISFNFNKSGQLEVSKGLIYIKTLKTLEILLKNQVITIEPNSKIILDANLNSVIIIEGNLSFDNKMVSANQSIRWLVDNFFVSENAFEKIKDVDTYKQLGYLLYNIDELPESLDFFRPVIR